MDVIVALAIIVTYVVAARFWELGQIELDRYKNQRTPSC
jgi:hypothetical protein